MEILYVVVGGVIALIGFFIGSRIGQKIVKGEEVKIPLPKPIKKAQEQQAQKEAKIEQQKLSTIIENIECYDGTSNGQKDVG